MKFNVITELKKLANGKRSKVPTAIVLKAAVSFLETSRKAEREKSR